MRIVGLIPARFASSRFPGKPLVEILGIPMVVRVAAIVEVALGRENVFVATESEEIRAVVEGAGYQAIMTSPLASTGTDRLAEAATVVKGDMYVNIQGDEPMLDPRHITHVVDAYRSRPDCVHNAMARVANTEDVNSPNLPKVVCTESGRLLYMSRSALPGFKDPVCAPGEYWKQVCIYAFAPFHLAAFAAFGRKSTLEKSEDIEILRFLDIGMAVQMVKVSGGSLAVDVPEDVMRVESALKAAM